MRKHDQSSAAAEGARRATGAAAERDRKGRFSARRKRATVLRLLRGEDLESVSRELGITAARASQWRDRFLAAGQAGLKSRATEAGDHDHRRLQAKIGELLMETELLYAKVDQTGGRPPFSPPEVDAMSGAQSISTRRAYGVQRVCRVWHGRGRVSMRGGRHRGTARAGIAAGPSVRPRTRSWWATSAGVLAASPFQGEGYRKVWAKLRVEGIRTSQERVRRLMRAHDLQAPHRVGQAHGPTAHDGTITTETPDVMWGTDMTATVTVAEGAAFVFVAVDHCTAECIGLHAAKRGTRFEAMEPIRQGVRERFGGIGDGAARGLRLRHDHGSNYLADDFQQEITFFGIDSSPSFVREPEGNGVAERFIRTLKENLLWVRRFETIRRPPPGLARVQADVQRTMDAREIRVPKPRAGATRPRRAGRDRVDANTVKPLSKNPGALHIVETSPQLIVVVSMPSRHTLHRSVGQPLLCAAMFRSM